MEAQAIARNVRIAPRKIGLVAGLVRGRSVSDALVILQHTPKKAAPMLAKVISSAAANARQKHSVKPEELSIASLQIGNGVHMKRYFTAAHGRARPYLKRSSNIHVVVSAPDKPAKASETLPANKPEAK